MADTDVIVVGAGPTGLTLAGELRLGGARVTVVERLAEPTGQSRGLGFTARAMEAFDQRGLLPRFGTPETSPVGHFGGVRFDYTVLPGAHFGARGIPQSRTEAVLEEWAVELGAVVHRGWEFTGLEAGDSAVEITVRTPKGRGGCAPPTSWAPTAGTAACARPPGSPSPAHRPPGSCTSRTWWAASCGRGRSGSVWNTAW